MTESSLYQALKTYTDSDAYPFHMPGHKRNRELLEGMLAESPYCIDITEINGFDNLHHAEGILKEAQDRAARLYGAQESFFLINGSTCGILAAIFAVTTQGGKLLMARNCHKAAYHAAELRGLRLRYLYPGWNREGMLGFADDEDSSRRAEPLTKNEQIASKSGIVVPIVNGVIAPEDVETALREDPEIQAVFLTSPTYDGVVSDVGEIAKITHHYGKTLVVDEAHGAHFGFHPYFPDSSVHLGADLVIHSLHKTLPSLTQTALLHVGRAADILDLSGRIRKYLNIFETSSPSYVLMAGIDQCVELIRARGGEMFETYAQRLSVLRRELSKLHRVHLFPESMTGWKPQIDPSKLILSLDGCSGQELAGLLRERYHLEMEMEAPDYVIALTSLADTQEGFDRLLQACRELDRKAAGEKWTAHTDDVKWKKAVCADAGEHDTISEAVERETENVLLENCAGRISAEYIYLYPPGIPLAVPGEELTEKLVEKLLRYRAQGLKLEGMQDYSGKYLKVCIVP